LRHASEIQEIVVAGDWAFMWTRLSVVVTPPNKGQDDETHWTHADDPEEREWESGCSPEMQIFSVKAK
jgi:hypothetical protein